MALDFADAMTSKSWVMIEGGGGPKYVGPDHSSLAGAKALARRLEQFWLSKGTPKKFEIYVAGRERDRTELIYGVREKKSEVAVRSRSLPFTPEQQATAMQIVRKTLMAHPEVPANVIMVTSQRTRKITAARRDCIRAVCAAEVFSSHYQIARFFNITCNCVDRILAKTDVAHLSKGEKGGRGVRHRKMVRA